MNLDFLHERMLARLPIEVKSNPFNIPVYSPSLINIANIGIEQYQKYMQTCVIGKEQLDEDGSSEVTDYDVLLFFLLKNIQLNQDENVDTIKQFINALKFFTKCDFMIRENGDDIEFINGDFTLNRNNYSEFRDIIKVSNCLDIDKKEEDMDEFDKIAAQIEKEMKEAEGGSGTDIPWKDLVSSVANMPNNNLNIINIWDINIYTFYEQMKRGQMYEAYNLGLKQILAGADPKNIKLEHYIAKI